jgi:hypothetical protein
MDGICWRQLLSTRNEKSSRSINTVGNGIVVVKSDQARTASVLIAWEKPTLATSFRRPREVFENGATPSEDGEASRVWLMPLLFRAARLALEHRARRAQSAAYQGDADGK